MADLTKHPLSYFLQEQRVTNLKQNDLITAQQHLIDLLAQILTENGLGEVLDGNGVSSLVGQAKAPGLKSILRTFGPTSAPMIWSGQLKDPILVEHKGVVTTARIVPSEEAQLWNRILDLNIRIRKYSTEIKEVEDQIDIYNMQLQRFDDDETSMSEEKAQLVGWLEDEAKKRAGLHGKLYQFECKVKSLNNRLRRRALQFLLRSNLRRKENSAPWVDEMEQKFFEGNVSGANLNKDVEDERKVDLDDTDSEI